MDNCIFCKIIKKEIPAKIIKETETILVIEDVAPKAPVHYLIIPKEHIINALYLDDSHKELSWDLLRMTRDLGQKLEGVKAFNILSNNGSQAGQSVGHMHLHFIAGRNIGKGEF